MAEEALRATRYKDAIDHYKALLREERKPDWVDNLAEAYAGRAEQLAAKDMLKEALALWRTRAEVCGVPLVLGPCLSWLMRLGEWDQVFGILSGAEPVSPDLRDQSETQLARVALTAPDDVLLKFPPQSPLLLHRSAAHAALAAYADGDAVAMNAHLRSIPFRSPYRDLRAILKALLLLPTDVEQAAAVIERVPAGGPFEPLAAALRVCVLPRSEWLAPLGGLDKNARALVLDIKGCPPEQRAAVAELSMLREDPAALFDLVARHRQVFPPRAAAQLCQRLLPHVPDRIKAFRANFVPVPPAEHQRVLALGAELRGDLDQAEAHWLSMIHALSPGQPARAALVLNHLAASHHHGGKPGELCEHGIEFLEQSLELDDGNRDTHLRLIRALRTAGAKPKELRKRLDGAMKRFPDELEILLEAMDSALESDAFKKAVELAKRVLELDPINPKVRSALGRAHLSQARKQIVAGNLKGARRELEEAGQWLRSDVERGALQLLQAFAAESSDPALLRAAVVGLGGSLPGIFHLLLEAQRTKRDAAELLRLVGAELDATPSAEEIVALANALNAAPDQDNALRAAIAPLEHMIRRAASLAYAESAHLLVCEALHRREHRGLTRRYAEAALKRWPGRPVFVYLRAAAMFAGNAWRIPRKERKAIEKACDAAQSQGDTRTASRLDALLTESGDDFEMFDRKTGLPAFLDPALTDPAAAIDAMFEFGGEDAFLEMVRKQFGKRTFEDLRREIGGNKKQFARRLMDMLGKADGLLGEGGVPNQGPLPAPLPAPLPTPEGARAPRKQRPVLPGQKDLFDD